jgi:hypothetical protein
LDDTIRSDALGKFRELGFVEGGTCLEGVSIDLFDWNVKRFPVSSAWGGGRGCGALR